MNLRKIVAVVKVALLTEDKKEFVRGVRARVRDAAFAYRMGAGFAGDGNTTHPAWIDPALQSATAPATAYGQAVVADIAGATTTIRPLVAGDQTLTDIWGITVRPYPIQPAVAAGNYGAQGIGAATPPAAGQIDVLRQGRIMVQLNPGQPSPTKGAPVYVRTTATSGNNIQGGFEVTLNGTTQANLNPGRYSYNGPADANGIVEIAIR